MVGGGGWGGGVGGGRGRPHQPGSCDRELGVG